MSWRGENAMQNVIISNSEKLEQLKSAVKAGGSENLRVIADFDKTMTKAFWHGKPAPSIIGILREENYLTSKYSRKAQALFEKYHPIEQDPKISVEEKSRAMKEWWEAHFELLIETGITKDDLRRVVESGKIHLREKCGELLDFLCQQHIPLVILSASGLGGDVIPMLLGREGKWYDENVHVISNSFVWGDDGRAIAVKQPIIHTLNKNETLLHEFPFFHEIRERGNVLLLGDSLHDIGMAEGFPFRHLIKIGFLNEGMEENMKYFKKVYDVIILRDGSMEHVNTLVKEIVLG